MKSFHVKIQGNDENSSELGEFFVSIFKVRVKQVERDVEIF